jgi:hypothetical protein
MKKEMAINKGEEGSKERRQKGKEEKRIEGEDKRRIEIRTNCRKRVQ